MSNPKFAGFPTAKRRQMWETHCTLDGNSDLVLGGNLLLTGCRASPGNSGSAMFVTTFHDVPASATNRHEEERIAGLVSNSMLVKRGQPRSKARVTVITIITKRKRLTICAMMSRGFGVSIAETSYVTVESCNDMTAGDARGVRSTFVTLLVNRLYSH